MALNIWKLTDSIDRGLLWVGRALPAPLRSRLADGWIVGSVKKRLAPRPDHTPLFEAVFFEVITKCNSRCSFCAASLGNDPRELKTMPFDLFRKVIAEMAEMNFTGRVAFHVNNDPLCFNGLEKFVAHARRSLPGCRLQIMTNGIALSPRRGRRLLECGVDEMVVDFYRRRPGEKLYPNLVRFRDQVIPEMYPVRRGKVHHTTDGSRSFRFDIHYRRMTEVRWNRGGSAPNKTAAHRAAGFCQFPFTQFNITTDGRVSKCCADFRFADVMGDVSRQGVMDVWNSAAFRAARGRLWAGDRQALAICRECDFFGVTNAAIPSPLARAVKILFMGH